MPDAMSCISNSPEMLSKVSETRATNKAALNKSVIDIAIVITSQYCLCRDEKLCVIAVDETLEAEY